MYNEKNRVVFLRGEVEVIKGEKGVSVSFPARFCNALTTKHIQCSEYILLLILPSGYLPSAKIVQLV